MKKNSGWPVALLVLVSIVGILVITSIQGDTYFNQEGYASRYEQACGDFKHTFGLDTASGTAMDRHEVSDDEVARLLKARDTVLDDLDKQLRQEDHRYVLIRPHWNSASRNPTPGPKLLIFY